MKHLAQWIAIHSDHAAEMCVIFFLLTKEYIINL